MKFLSKEVRVPKVKVRQTVIVSFDGDEAAEFMAFLNEADNHGTETYYEVADNLYDALDAAGIEPAE